VRRTMTATINEIESHPFQNKVKKINVLIVLL